jgi:predicted aspartyl protease
MSRLLTRLGTGLLLALICVTAQANEFATVIPMLSKGMSTFYVKGNLDGVGEIDLLVDTGSGYMTINEEALQMLLSQNRAGYVKELTGVLADGSKMVVPVYALESLSIGKNCTLRNVEAAVFPGRTRYILGLSALQKAGPFIFTFDPPSLSLSNCSTATG